MTKLRFAVIFSALAVSQIAAASAATSNGEKLAPMAIVQSTCVAGVNGFGLGSGLDEESGMTALVSITCTRSTPWSVLLNAGRECGAATVTGEPTDAKFTVVYSPFPEVTGGLDAHDPMLPGSISGMGTSTPQVLTIYFGAAGGQHAQPSTGSDAIVAEITY